MEVEESAVPGKIRCKSTKESVYGVLYDKIIN